jgi:hypothetical protein
MKKTKMKIPEGMKKAFEEKHFEDVNLMINFYDYFEDAEILEDTVEGIEYKYLEIYCKNNDCDCTEIVLHIYRDDEYLGDARYDYKQQRLTTEYNHLINLDTLIEASELFEVKHEYVKSRFEVESLEREEVVIRAEIEGYKKGIKNMQSAKIGRNQPCPCGSGKKYKRCCLEK